MDDVGKDKLPHSQSQSLSSENEITIGGDLNEDAVGGAYGLNDLSGGRGGIITARGTLEGVVIRLDGRVEPGSLKDALVEFLDARKAFLAGNEVLLEWVGVRPEDSLVSELSDLLAVTYNITVKSSKLKEPQKVSASLLEASLVGSSSMSPSAGNLNPGRYPGSSFPTGNLASRVIGSQPGRFSPDKRETVQPSGSRSLSLFDGMEALSSREASREQSGSRRDSSYSSFAEDARAKNMNSRQNLIGDSSFWDDPDARIIYSTLRSGQKIETDHSLIIFGDVNSGAELIAGGDIVVLGTLRGVAHAGAYDETGGGRVIFALNLQATQLRIGMVISRGSSDSQKVAEIAKVDNGTIVVEPYMVKSLGNRRRD